MHITARLSLFAVGLALFLASPVMAQPAIAHFSQVEGTVTRLQRFVPSPASVGVVLVEGDQIVTAVGRAELSFVDGSLMHLDRHTQVVIAGAARIRLIDGRVSLRTTSAYTAETASGVVHVLPAGIFELTASAANRDMLVRVVEGDAQIESPRGVESVAATETAFVSGSTGRSYISAWIQTGYDSFGQWCHARYQSIVPTPRVVPLVNPSYRHAAFERTVRDRFDRHRANAPIRGDRKIRGGQRRDRAAAPSGRGAGPAPAPPPPKAKSTAAPPAKAKPVRAGTVGVVRRR
jgi:hypothetical protein